MRTTKALLFIGLALTALAATASADKPTKGPRILGKVVDQQTQQPISGATVAVFPTADSVFTDSSGNFSIQLPGAGTFAIEIKHPAYEKKLITDIQLTPRSSVDLTVELTPVRTKQSERERLSGAISLPEMAAPKPSGDAKQKSDESYYDAARRALTSTLSSGQTLGADEQSIGRRPRQLPQPHKRPPVVFEPPVIFPGGTPYDMFFRDYGTNRFVPTYYDRFSTFAADVDDASYTLARRYLDEGYLPPSDAIRIEEFVNHFDFEYEAPRWQTFNVVTHAAPSPFDDSTTIIAIGIKGRDLPRVERKPMNLTFVIDVSGSMGYDNRLEVVKYALTELANQLNGRDRIGIVTYGNNARVVMYPTPADNSREIARALACLRPGGSTNAEAGLRIGYRMARQQFTHGHTNRIILCSDGVANVGLTSPEALMEEIQQRAGDGITLSSFGVGMGNYNDVLLEKLAQQGNGRYAYMNDRREAYRVMVTDFLENVQLLARDVKIQVEFDPEVVRSYRLLGYENRDVQDHQFRDNRADGGEIGPGHEVTALYEIVWQHRPARVLGTIALRWKDENGEEVTELNRDLVYPRLKRGRQMSTDLRLAVAAAKFSEMLKGTVYVRDLQFDELYRFAESLREERPTEQTFELLDMIRRADEFSTYHTRR